MSDPFVESISEARTIEVRIWRRGRLLGTELCESEEQASLAFGSWSAIDGVDCEVADLSGGRFNGRADGGPPEPEDEAYPESMELEREYGDALRYGE